MCSHTHISAVILFSTVVFSIQQTCRGAEIDAVLPLPQWSPGFNQSFPPLGGQLLPEGLLDDAELDSSASLSQQVFTQTHQIDATRQTADLSLFLPDALLGKAIRPRLESGPTTEGPVHEVDAGFLAACREAAADEHLIDPDSHVTETQREDLMRFLDFHARDARIKAYVIVTDRDQSITSITNLSGVASGKLSAQDACLAIYPLGAPSRARLVVSDSVRKVSAPDNLANLVDDCAREAAQVSDPLEQLHRFTVRLSIRLFWLERMIGSNKAAVIQTNAEDISAEITAKREAALTAALDERDTPKSRSPLEWSSIVFGMILSLAGGAATWAALSYRRKRLLGYVWVLPEIEIPPRLGGAFSGGGGCSIQYR